MRSSVTDRAMVWSILGSLTLGIGAAFGQNVPPPQSTAAAALAPAASRQSFRRVTEDAATLAGGLSVQLNKTFHREGEPLVVTVDIPREGYLNVLSVGPDDLPTVLFPNQHHPDNRVAAGPFTIPTAQMKFDLKATPPYGVTLVTAFLSKEPLDFYQNGTGERDEQGAMQEPFARLSAASRSQLRQLAAKSFAALPRAAPLLGGMAYGMVCASSGPCDAASTPGAPTEFEDKLTPGILLEDEVSLPKGIRPRAVYDKGIRLTKVSEGFVPRLYNDAARYCSIAYGHLVKKAPCDGKEPPEFRRGLGEPRGESLLVQDLRRAQLAVMGMVTTALSDGQYAALCDFTYNVGASKLQKSTLLKAVNAGEHERVPFQLRRWIKANGMEHAGLKTRREREIQLYFEGLPIPRVQPADEDLSVIDIRTGE
ncbi:MAG: Lysozyme RrrD [Candidatus Accumulibacter phosphatis]|uniref:Lysozyme n=1 Tax=Candidatus Accumulibacter phosphatis TaxID=327160 RepID=A0A080LZI7_9PROT|nr:DUF4384 domain-containing protein [Accumulibacter sp.]KFB74323.1 MAG: Lysozyme RrrD [Candidatus Accumulibacter phosphatis]MBL8409314.1 DUF4384 domain-containing protein [Accumulibacter sp.]HRF11538.1 DUF4384 domain-containing protein [Candidatus Accumulibacter phosphatis]